MSAIVWSMTHLPRVPQVCHACAILSIIKIVGILLNVWTVIEIWCFKIPKLWILALLFFQIKATAKSISLTVILIRFGVQLVKYILCSCVTDKKIYSKNLVAKWARRSHLRFWNRMFVVYYKGLLILFLNQS